VALALWGFGGVERGTGVAETVLSVLTDTVVVNEQIGGVEQSCVEQRRLAETRFTLHI
jgi:hypothetical protein